MVEKYCSIEAGTVVVDVAGLIVIDENILVGTFETMDKVVVAKDVDEVVDILLDSKKP